MASAANVPLMRIRGLTKTFPVRGGLFRRHRGDVRAVDDVSFDIGAGETVGIVGESGCGKTTLGRLLLRLLDATAGRAEFRSRTMQAHGCPDSIDVLAASARDMKLLRRDLQIVFQDPYSSLNPRLSVGTNIGEPLRAAGVGKMARRETVARLLADVGLRTDVMTRYPHELSGGQRQRVAIARALALAPQLIVADEAVSALDVSIQAQVLNLFLELQRDRGLSFVFVGHNLAVVRYVSHRIAVMYLGRIVELAETDALFARPRHPYTEALIASIPSGPLQHTAVAGEAPDPARPPTGCPFHPRCRYAEPRCAAERPALRQITPATSAACHLADKLTLTGA